jgi:hypothetical protein
MSRLIDRDADVARKLAVVAEGGRPAALRDEIGGQRIDLGGGAAGLNGLGGGLQHFARDLAGDPHLADLGLALDRDL